MIVCTCSSDTRPRDSSWKTRVMIGGGTSSTCESLGLHDFCNCLKRLTDYSTCLTRCLQRGYVIDHGSLYPLQNDLALVLSFSATAATVTATARVLGLIWGIRKHRAVRLQEGFGPQEIETHVRTSP